MASAINVGSLNLPKMMRHLSHRSSQVRDLTFVRDAIKQKDVKTTKSGGTLEGPPVSFGYEKSSSDADAGTDPDTVYHADSPEIVLPGLTMLQSPIVSRRGRLEKIGHRITGACTFYAPPLDYIKALDNFKDANAFAELESYDKLYDMEKIIEKIPDYPQEAAAATTRIIKTFDDKTAGYQIDRLQFKINCHEGTLTKIILKGDEGGSNRSLTWGGAIGLGATTTWTTIDIPLRDIEVGDTTSVYKGGVRYNLTAATEDTILDLDKLYGAPTYDLSSLVLETSSAIVELRDIYLYKEAEWRVESIKEYRDEYMQLAAVRVRGDRASRRRAYG